jgi:small subunit ribosomal protein S1
MAKELIRPQAYRKANQVFIDEEFTLSPEMLADMEALYGQAANQYNIGQLIQGAIIDKDSSGVIVDINYKSNGFIPSYEFSEEEFENLKLGDQVEVILDELENFNGVVVLSYENAKALRAWEVISKLFEAGKPVQGLVTHKVKGGLSVDVGVPAFLPGSQIDLHRVIDFDQYVGKKITADIIKLNKKRGNVILSRRKHLAERRDESRKQILEGLAAGQVIQGTVKNITNYGVFIDIGGVDGLLHITDMTWGRISHPSEIVKMGDTVSVKVLSIDKDNNKISLGMKQLEENPWQELAQTIKVGARVKGKVASITDYGLFVEVQKGIEGLVHISEISWTDRITDLAERYKVGEEIDVHVVSLDVDNRRMSLSIKQLDKNPWAMIKEDYKIGQTIKGTITNITDFGIFIQIIPGVDGLAHVSDLSWTEHIDHPSDIYKKGQEIHAAILSIDEDSKKIALGIKQLTQDPWENVAAEYPLNSLVKGTVTKIVTYGAFVKIPNGIEGLVHTSEFAERKDDPIEVGQVRELRVVNINKDERKLTLSLQLEPAPRKEVAKKRPAGEAQAPVVERKEKEAPVKTSSKSAAAASMNTVTTTTSTASKTKSAFQLELEKHVAKKTSEDAE